MRILKILIYIYLFSIVIIACKNNPSSSEDNSNSDNTDNNSSKIEFEDDFSSNNLDWQICGGNWHLDDEVLFIYGPDSNENVHIAYKVPDSRFTQPIKYAFDVDFVGYASSNILHSRGSYGLGFANNDDLVVCLINNYYKEYLLAHLEEGLWSYPIPNTGHSSITHSPVTMELNYINDSLELYYNDELLDKSRWPELSFDSFFIFHQYVDTIKFDNVRFTGSS